MGARRWVVIGVLAATSTGYADRTLEPSKLTLAVPEGWTVVQSAAGTGDELSYESSEDSEPRVITIAFSRITGECKTWKAPASTRKESPLWWPKGARTAVYTRVTQGRIDASGCLANTPTGALVAQIAFQSETPKYKPSQIDRSMVLVALAGALRAAGQETPAPATSGMPRVDPQLPQTTPETSAGTSVETVKGGTLAKVPRIDIAVKLPASGRWIVARRGDSSIERAGDGAVLRMMMFPVASRSCNEWRVDSAATSTQTFVTKAAYLPSSIKAGAFTAAIASTEISTCIDSKGGPLGVTALYGKATLEPADATVVRSLLDGVAVGAAKRKTPWLPASDTVEAGTKVEAAAATIKLPAGATWRLVDGTIERFDKGRYFSLASMSRPGTCAAAATAATQPYLPAGIKATVETRAGATIVKACVDTTRAIELTLAYDGAIATADHALIRALVEAFAAKPAAKT